jgi:hypothetical protein
MAPIDPKTTLERARGRRNGVRSTGQVDSRVDRVERSDLTVPSGLIEGISGITDPSYIRFTKETSEPSAGWVEGHLYWDADWDILSVRLNDDVDMHLGMSIYMPPTNNASGVTIPRGAFVMATGVTGDRITIAKAVTDGSVLPDYMLGVAAHDILAGDTDGKIVTQGEVRQMDTSAYTVGTILYPDPTTPGGWTSTKPAAPNIGTAIAFVTRQHVNTGRIMVRNHLGSVLGGTDQNVKFGTPADGDAVTWDSAQSLWINEPVSTNALPGISGTGIVVRSATTPTYTVRQVTGTSNRIAITNGDGVSGNINVNFPTDVIVVGKLALNNGWPVGGIAESRVTTATVTSTTASSYLATSTVAKTAESIVIAKIWGFYGVTSGTPTLKVGLRYGGSLASPVVMTLDIPTIASQSSSTSNPWEVEFFGNFLTTDLVSAFGRATWVNNADAEGDRTGTRIKVADSFNVGTTSSQWQVIVYWSGAGGTATVIGGYIDYARK